MLFSFYIAFYEAAIIVTVTISIVIVCKITQDIDGNILW